MDELLTIQSMATTCPTPFYLFDEGVLAHRIATLRTVLPTDTSICYAMKANPFVTEAASKAADLLEVCSPGELEVCRALRIPYEKLVISGVYKERSVMQGLIAGGAPVHRYTVESPAQFALLQSLAHDAGVRIPVLLRLTSGSQFGMDVQDLTRLMRKGCASKHLDIRGIQYFSGTQKRSVAKLRRELARLDQLITQLQEQGIAVQELEYGPGLPFDYAERDRAARDDADHKQLTALAEALTSLGFGGTRILEIGRGIAATCGTYVTRVVDTKCNRGHHYAIVDGGKHQLVFYGQSLAFKPPVAHFLPERSAGQLTTWTVCGALCATGDTLVAQAELADLQVGDLVVFPNTGAYSMTEGMSLFLSRDLPRVYLRDAAGAVRLVRDRFDTHVLNTPLP